MPVPSVNGYWKKFVQKVVDKWTVTVLIMTVPGRWTVTGGTKKRRQKRETVFNQKHNRIRKHFKGKRVSLNRLYRLWKHSSKINASLEREGGRWGLKHRRSDNDWRLTVLLHISCLQDEWRNDPLRALVLYHLKTNDDLVPLITGNNSGGPYRALLI